MKLKKILTIIFSFIIIIFYSISASASGESVTDADIVASDTDSSVDISSDSYDEKKGIAIVRLTHTTDNGTKDVLRSGYAFFIGDETNTYLISCYDSVILTDAEQESIAASYGVEKDKLGTELELILKDDIVLSLSVINSSSSMDFAILKPDSSMHVSTSLRLCTEVNSVTEGTNVHTYDNDMQTVACNIEDWSEIDGIHYFRYTSDKAITKGMPLINEDGEVIGIVSSANKGNAEQHYAVWIDEITDVLDMLDISYNQEIALDISELEEAMKEYEELKPNKYTSDTWASCEAAYDQAAELIAEIDDGEINSYTQTEIDSITNGLNESMSSLEKAEISISTVIKAAIIIGVALLIIIILMIVMMIIKARGYKRQIKDEGKRSVMAKEALKLSGRITPGAINNNISNHMPVNRSLNSGGMDMLENPNTETTVLNSDVDLTVGIKDYPRTFPTLVRYKTGESVKINQNSFIIGSSQEMVDYCIRYNSNISRKHACIMRFEDGYYIQDLDTTNGTFVNDMKVNAGRYVKLVNGSIIKFADEEFLFEE